MAKLKYEYFVKSSLKSTASEFLRTTRCHPSVNKYLFEDKKISREEQESWYELYSKDLNIYIHLVIEKKSGLYIGYVTLKIKSLYHRRCEVGFVVHPDFQSNGYGLAMVKWSIKEAAKLEEGIHKLSLTVFPWNESAIRIYEKAGFEKEGCAREYVFKKNEYFDVLFMSLLLTNELV